MADLFRRFFQLFGARYVMLMDYNGDRHIRRVEFRGGHAFARRHKYDIANVWLGDNGVASGVTYVTRWEPYEPGSAPHWPRFAGIVDG